MAKTFYGYAEREVDSFVDWSKIGQDITSMLQAEVQFRDQKKAAIDEATKAFEEKIQNAPMGEYTELNDYLSRYSDDVTQAMLIQERLLKTGQLKVKDYVLGRDNLVSGTNGMFAFAKEFQEVYKQKMDGILSDDPEKRLSQRTAHEMELAEGLAKFENTRAIINPTNYKVGIAKTKKNEKTGMDELTDEIMSISQMRNILRTNYKAYNVDKNTQAQADSLGALEVDIVELANRGGEYTSVTRIIDATGKTLKDQGITDEDKKMIEKIQSGYKEWEDLTVTRMTQNPDDVASILVDGGVLASNGKAYAFTESKEEAEKKKQENLIYINRRENQRGIPEIDPDDLELAKGVLKANIRRKVDRKIQNAKLQEKSRNPLLKEYYDDAKDAKLMNDSLDRYSPFFTGGTADKKPILESLDNNPGVKDAFILDNGTEGTYVGYKIIDNQTGKVIDEITKGITIRDATGEPSSPFQVGSSFYRNNQLMTSEGDKVFEKLSDEQLIKYLESKGFKNPKDPYVRDAKGGIVYEEVIDPNTKKSITRPKSRINLEGLEIGVKMRGMERKEGETRSDIIDSSIKNIKQNLSTPMTINGTKLYSFKNFIKELDRAIITNEDYKINKDGNIEDSEGKEVINIEKQVNKGYEDGITESEISKVISGILQNDDIINITAAKRLYSVGSSYKYTNLNTKIE